jgi:DNA repair protein RadC
MSSQMPNNSIKSWSEDDRPREKMLAKGHKSLTDSELLAIILGSGSRGESAVSLSRRILSDNSNSLHELGKVSIQDLVKKYKGVGEAKAINIIACLELGRRRQGSEAQEKQFVTSSRDAYDLILPELADLRHEEFWVLLCNSSLKLMAKHKVASGLINGVNVDARSIIKPALDNLANVLFLCHNHPSGSPKPSNYDVLVTKNIVKASEVFSIKIADHIIIGDNTYYSFADNNLFDKWKLEELDNLTNG